MDFYQHLFTFEHMQVDYDGEIQGVCKDFEFGEQRDAGGSFYSSRCSKGGERYAPI